MYLVDTPVFKSFIDKNNLSEGYIPKPAVLPCIIEFNRTGVLKAKVEVSSYEEFLAVVKFDKEISQQPKNKYWIRGDEWETDSNGNLVKEMNV